MKSNKYQRRFYRDWVTTKDLHFAQIVDTETDLAILANKSIDRDFVRERIHSYRWDIENYIAKDRRFLTALKPIEVEINAPSIVKEMNRVARLANVGPMASVAGAIAQFLGRDLLNKGYRDVIIENGGDIFIKTTKRRNVGIYVAKTSLWQNFALKIRPLDTPLGICTSSGRLGHSLSFGLAEAAVILSKNAALADAVATATANRIKSEADLKKAMDFARSVRNICGAIIIFKKTLICWGKIEFTPF